MDTCGMCGAKLYPPFIIPSSFDLDEGFCSIGCRDLAELLEVISPGKDTFYLKRSVRDLR